MRQLSSLLVASVVLAAAAHSAAGQSGQSLSAQGSALYTVQQFGTGKNVGGPGIELQARYAHQLLSIGVGYQFSSHSLGSDNIKLNGAFVEPRYAIDIGSDRVAPYVAARLAWLSQSSDFGDLGTFSSRGAAFGAGAGVVVGLTPRLNFDAGAAFIRQSFGDATTSTGRPVTFTPFNGYVAKAGLSIGLGK